MLFVCVVGLVPPNISNTNNKNLWQPLREYAPNKLIQKTSWVGEIQFKTVLNVLLPINTLNSRLLKLQIGFSHHK